MGQQGSIAGGGVRTSVARIDERHPTRLRPLPPNYVPLCDTIKAGDPTAGAVAVTTEDIKDALTKILEFSHAIRFLPKGKQD